MAFGRTPEEFGERRIFACCKTPWPKLWNDTDIGSSRGGVTLESATDFRAGRRVSRSGDTTSIDGTELDEEQQASVHGDGCLARGAIPSTPLARSQAQAGLVVVPATPL